MKHHRGMGGAVVLATVALLLLGGLPQARAGQETPGRATTITAAPADTAPVIDGRLDDACWEQATRMEGFYCPDHDGPAPEETIALLCADRQAIYIGVTCKDRSPADIVAGETRRNGDLGNDDYIRVAIDPQHSHRDYFTFEVNPAGTQCDAPPGDSAAKIEWRGDWKAAAMRTEDGWQAELSIPFSILRCPPGQTTFGLILSRSHAQERVSSVWPNLGRAWDNTLSADLCELHPQLPSPRPVLMPYLVADTGDGYERGVDAGLDVQQKLPNGLTVLGSYNPDFRQIEDVVEPISFSYTERYLSDPRPFFVTGQDGYLPREHLLYTRRIRDFDAGVKLFGTIGDDTIGILDAITFGEENSFAAAVRHNFGDDFTAKLMAVSHSQQGEHENLAYGLDACYNWRRPGVQDSLWTVLYESRDVDSGGSYAIGGAHNAGAGATNYDWMARVVTDGFAPALGYWPDTGNIGGSLNLQHTDIYEDSAWFGKQWGLSTEYYPYLNDGGILRAAFRPAYYCLTKGGQLYGIEVERGKDHNYDNSSVSAIHGWHDNDTYRRGQLVVVKGNAAGGDLTYAKLDQGLRPTEKLSLRVQGEYTALTGTADSNMHEYQTVLTGSYDLTTEKCVAARAIWRESGFSAYAAYRQVVRRGMDAYVILGDPDPSTTGFTNRVVVKLIWAL